METAAAGAEQEERVHDNGTSKKKRSRKNQDLKGANPLQYLQVKPVTFEVFKKHYDEQKQRKEGTFIEPPKTAEEKEAETPTRDKLMVKMTSLTGQIVECILNAHGFVSTIDDCNVLWTGGHLKGGTIKALNLNPYQRINHFPRTFEITRKDRLYNQITRMGRQYGLEEYGFIPEAFVIPAQLSEANEAIKRGSWILKPVGSSRGRGIFVVNPEKPLKATEEKKSIVCKYINNPLLIGGFKFDLRVYALVTSFDPLVVWVYEEGLCRFATEKYKSATETYNRFVHLTNYSVNKMNKSKFVANQDEAVEDSGCKWTFAALKKYFEGESISYDEHMAKVHDVVIKTFLSVKEVVSESVDRFVPFRNNSFELFGFDVLLDENFHPWLLEVNLSPSLQCDSPLDHKIKSNLVCDMLNMVGVAPYTLNQANPEEWSQDPRVVPHMAHKDDIVRLHKEHYERRGRWNRVYPCKKTFDHYNQFQETQSYLNQYTAKALLEDEE